MHVKRIFLTTTFSVIVAVGVCYAGSPKNISDSLNKGVLPMKLSSAAFTEGAFIPVKYACTGENISPQLSWTGAPVPTKSFALICDDPDAPGGTWVHWVIYNIPADVNMLSEKIAAVDTLSYGMIQGSNDFRRIGYGGPCPPHGSHRYFFKLYALDVILPEKKGITKVELMNAMAGHILGEAQLMGKFKK